MLSFLFPIHLSRLAYFVRLVLVEALVVFCANDVMDQDAWNSNRLTSLAILAVLVIYGVFFIYLPRVRDCGIPAWTLVFALVPVLSGLYGLVLLFAPSRGLRFSGGPQTPESLHVPPVIPGNKCMACGKPLVVAADGVANPYGGALCNECHASSAEQATGP